MGCIKSYNVHSWFLWQSCWSFENYALALQHSCLTLLLSSVCILNLLVRFLQGWCLNTTMSNLSGHGILKTILIMALYSCWLIYFFGNKLLFGSCSSKASCEFLLLARCRKFSTAAVESKRKSEGGHEEEVSRTAVWANLVGRTGDTFSVFLIRFYNIISPGS